MDALQPYALPAGHCLHYHHLVPVLYVCALHALSDCLDQQPAGELCGRSELGPGPSLHCSSYSKQLSPLHAFLSIAAVKLQASFFASLSWASLLIVLMTFFYQSSDKLAFTVLLWVGECCFVASVRY